MQQYKREKKRERWRGREKRRKGESGCWGGRGWGKEGRRMEGGKSEEK